MILTSVSLINLSAISRTHNFSSMDILERSREGVWPFLSTGGLLHLHHLPGPCNPSTFHYPFLFFCLFTRFMFSWGIFPWRIYKHTSHICPPSHHLAEAVPGDEEDYPCISRRPVIRKQSLRACVRCRHGGSEI